MAALCHGGRGGFAASLLEHKFYAPGIGNVLTLDAHTGDGVELIRITTD